MLILLLRLRFCTSLFFFSCKSAPKNVGKRRRLLTSRWWWRRRWQSLVRVVVIVVVVFVVVLCTASLGHVPCPLALLYCSDKSACSSCSFFFFNTNHANPNAAKKRISCVCVCVCLFLFSVSNRDSSCFSLFACVISHVIAF